MRIAAIAAAAILASAGSAMATPASVEVKIGPELQVKAKKNYGEREVREVAQDLQKIVAGRLAKTPAYDGARVELTLVDAAPNRPTQKQMSDRPGLSFQSFSIGGAAVEGRVVSADGTVTPVKHAWYETDITWERWASVWNDADTAFQQFAGKLARGQQLASR